MPAVSSCSYSAGESSSGKRRRKPEPGWGWRGDVPYVTHIPHITADVQRISGRVRTDPRTRGPGTPCPHGGLRTCFTKKGRRRRGRKPCSISSSTEGASVGSRFEVDDQLWAEIEPLIPVKERRRRYPGRLPRDDPAALNGILDVLNTGIAWRDFPHELGYGSGVTCWRRLRDWQAVRVWEELHQRLLVRLNEVGQIDPLAIPTILSSGSVEDVAAVWCCVRGE